MNNTDRWSIDGDCTQCRKRNYCGKPCKKRAYKMRKDIYDVVSAKSELAMVTNFLRILNDNKHIDSIQKEMDSYDIKL